MTLNPGTFAGYAWNTGVSTPTIAVTIGGTYRVTVTDDNGCHASDTVTVTFLFPPITSIKMVSIETDPTSPLYSNNKVMWETDLGNVDSVIVYRETTTNNYEVVGKVAYNTGAFTDTVSSKLRSWAYKIQFQDTCNNMSGLSDYHKTCKVSVNVTVGGFTANWTDYEIEGGEKALLISKYEIYTGEVLNALSYLTYVPGSQNTYGPFAFTDSLVVVAAVITTTTKTEITALSFPITEYDAVSIGEYQDLLTFDLYPNPSTGDFTVSGEGMLSIYNVIGECIFTETIDGTKTIHLNNSGIYMVKMTNKQNATFIQKVIIQ
ncbi:MAG TPA: T9SS type A sorting domain-containing protein [Bacteroidales bacterium]|nr:T9SS type A sorting domain-containing protein [Bacteroidales bacterium]